MAKVFRGQLWLAGDEQGALDVVVQVEGGQIAIVSGTSDIADWNTSELVVTESGDAYQLTAEGETLFFRTADSGFLEAVGGKQGLAERFKAAQPDSHPTAEPTYERLTASAEVPTSGGSWWSRLKRSQQALIITGVVVLVAAINGAVTGSGADPVSPPRTQAAAEPDVPDQSDTGDWSSVSSYLTDVEDTANKMTTLLDTVAEMSFSVADGTLTLNQYSQLLETAIESASSHEDYFRGTASPAGFEEAHGHLQRSLGLFVDSFERAKEGADTGNLALIDEAAELMQRGTDAINQATASLPNQ